MRSVRALVIVQLSVCIVFLLSLFYYAPSMLSSAMCVERVCLAMQVR